MEDLKSRKSILEGMEIKEHGMEVLKRNPPKGGSSVVYSRMVVVGHCPQCGSPIYGNRDIGPNEVPCILRSCSCVPVVSAHPLH